MNEIIFNTVISFSKKEIVKNGIKESLDAIAGSFANAVISKYVDMISEDLKDEENIYQFILSVNKVSKCPGTK